MQAENWERMRRNGEKPRVELMQIFPLINAGCIIKLLTK